MPHCIQDGCSGAENKIWKDEGLGKNPEQKQGCEKSHIKQLPVHVVFIVGNVADKKKPSVEENLQPQGS